MEIIRAIVIVTLVVTAAAVLGVIWLLNRLSRYGTPIKRDPQ